MYSATSVAPLEDGRGRFGFISCYFFITLWAWVELTANKSAKRPKRSTSLPGFEPGIFWSVVRRVIRCATSPVLKMAFLSDNIHPTPMCEWPTFCMEGNLNRMLHCVTDTPYLTSILFKFVSNMNDSGFRSSFLLDIIPDRMLCVTNMVDARLFKSVLNDNRG